MYELLNNSWICGIITGIVSGFIVFYVTAFLSKRQEKKLIKIANEEILENLYDVFIKGQVIENQIARSIIWAISNKYNLNERKVVFIEDVGKQMIMKVINNKQLSAKKKAIISKNIYMNLINYKDDRPPTFNSIIKFSMTTKNNNGNSFPLFWGFITFVTNLIIKGVVPIHSTSSVVLSVFIIIVYLVLVDILLKYNKRNLITDKLNYLSCFGNVYRKTNHMLGCINKNKNK